MKSFTIDSTEQHIYFGSFSNPLDVCRLSANTGIVVDSQRYSYLDGRSHSIRIHLFSDNSGYCITGRDSSGIAEFCKYEFSNPTNVRCQQITKFQNYAFGQLKISDATYFIIGFDSPTYNLHMYKLTFGNLFPEWALVMNCPSGA